MSESYAIGPIDKTSSAVKVERLSKFVRIGVSLNGSCLSFLLWLGV